MPGGRNQAMDRDKTEIRDGTAHAVIAEKVLRYFQQNTQAMDSVEGIARFWVREDRSVVEECLADLHRRGLLARRTIAGTDFYSLAEPRAGFQESPSPAVTPSSRGEVPERSSAPLAEAGGRILVVDDDESVKRFIESALADAGYTVSSADDGESALEMFRAEPFDLVVTDLKMPGLSGIQLLEAVKRHQPAVEVIVVTAYATLDTAVKALRHGAYDLITKPLEDLEALFRVVGRALERRRLAGENRLLVTNLQARNVELKEIVSRLAAVNDIGKVTTGLLDLPELYDSLVKLIARHLNARRVSVFVSEPDADTMSLVASVGIHDDEAQARSVRIGDGIAGQVAATQKPLLVEDISKSPLRARSGGGKYSTPSFMITPLTVSYPIHYQRRRVGVINVSDKHSGDPFTDQDLEFLSTLAAQVAVAIENARLVKEMEEGYFGVVVSMVQALEDARPETLDHSARVAALSADVARALGLPEPRVELLVKAAALHEIGRLASRADGPPQGQRSAPKERQDRGDAAEAGGAASWTAPAVMSTERLLAPIVSLRPVREILLRSADWHDSGSGKRVLRTDRAATPIESRILAACEEFVRLTPGDDPDRNRRSAALDRLRRLAGRRFDPEVIEALANVVDRPGANRGGS
jgi:response regulator RpfG family c-di-GMP phosphodiesterase